GVCLMSAFGSLIRPGGSMAERRFHLRERASGSASVVERIGIVAEDTYDVVVLGSGTGGYATALRAAELGKRVAIVERDDRLGGTCLLRGCIPSKALLESAAVMDRINRSQEWGINASGQVDWPKVVEAERHIVEKKVSGLTGLIKARKVDVIRGTGKLAAGPAVQVDGRTIRATDVVLATGSYPRMLPGLEVGDRI